MCNREIPPPLTLFAAGDAAELKRAADELDEANRRQGRWSVIRHGSSERTVCCSLKCARVSSLTRVAMKANEATLTDTAPPEGVTFLGKRFNLATDRDGGDFHVYANGDAEVWCSKENNGACVLFRWTKYPFWHVNFLERASRTAALRVLSEHVRRKHQARWNLANDMEDWLKL